MANYDRSSVQSIYEFALKLRNKSLGELISLPEGIENQRNRGDLGTLLEKYYFEYEPPIGHGPDFPEAGLELKTTGVILNKNGKFRAKERLVLSMINYDLVARETWEESYLLKKCRLMLILFYQFVKDVPVINRKFVIDPLIYRMSAEDEVIIKRDWNTIRKKILDGKAHELSEGDTFYLAACRKGSGGISELPQKQPFSEELAKSRAFSFKPGYLNKLLEGHSVGESSLGISEKLEFEEATQRRFRPYIGMSIEQISSALNYHKKDMNQKGFYRLLSNRILAAGGQTVVEIEKAGIEIKTIRLNKKGKPRESMSFPGFRTLEIIHEDWEDSSFAEKIERKFLFIVFREDEDGIERLTRAIYWNMPYEDRLEAKRVWEETKKRVFIDAKNLPTAKESHVAHVRPKARNGHDKELSPQGEMIVKKCFWLNSGYIEQILDAL